MLSQPLPPCSGYDRYKKLNPKANETLFRAACVSFAGSEIQPFEGEQYCLLHSPDPEKKVEFGELINSWKAGCMPANFRGAFFPADVEFYKVTFKEDMEFNGANFSGEVKFTRCKFEKRLDFDWAHFFQRASFPFCEFDSEVAFVNAEFDGSLSFPGGVFEKNVYFDRAKFRKGCFTNFNFSRFKDLARFINIQIDPKADIYFGEAVFEQPDRIHFHTINDFKPEWLINTDCRKFNFQEVSFSVERTWFANYCALRRTENFLGRLVNSSKFRQYLGIDLGTFHSLRGTACDRIADNAEQNKRFHEASDFRYMAMETDRLAKANGVSFWTLHWWYWLSSGYGEKIIRAFIILILIWVFFAGAYSFLPCRFTEKVNDSVVEHSMDLEESAFYSISVLTLQKSSPEPGNLFTKIIVWCESIIGPLQAALLGLAIRRKFIR